MRIRPSLRIFTVIVAGLTGVALPGAPVLPVSQEPHPQYVSRIWRTQDGLPENRIRAIAQTPDGYLWVGTSSGLARFDGVRFVVYTRFNTPSMTEDSIRALAIAKDGSLWIGTDGGGLLHYQGSRFESLGFKDGLTNEFVGAVMEDLQGTLWAATNRGLFRRQSGKRFERVDEPLGLQNIAFFRLLVGNDGKVYSAGPSGLFRFDAGKLAPYGPRDQWEGVYRVIQRKDGAFWLGTNRGLRAFGNRTQDATRPYANSMMGAIIEDRQGNVWLGTEGEGVFRVGAGGETVIRAPTVLPNNNILALLEDREENIWVGTSDGLARLSPPDVGLLTRTDGLTGDNITSVYCDRQPGIWLNTVTGETARYADGRLETVHLPGSAARLRIHGVFRDYTGALWFGTDNQGVARVANGKATRFTTADGLRNNGTQAFFEDREHTLWIGTTSGISRWDGAKFTNYYVEQGLSYGWIRAIGEDGNGDILIATDRGMNRFHDGKFVKDKAFEQLSRDKVWSIYRDPQGVLWLGTRGAGLVRVQGEKVSRITTQEGLLSNSIFQVLGDGKGRLWMSSPRGISSAAFKDLNALADGNLREGVLLSYGIGHGSDSTQMNGGIQTSGCLASDGELWFPSVKGAVHFRPGQPRVSHPAPVLIEAVLVDDRAVANLGNIVIGPGRSRVKIEFTANNLRTPERVTFRYRLDGYDTRWITARERSAIYDNLPPAQYTFHVATDEGPEGNVSSEAGFSLRVKPHFYETGWFDGLALLLAAACIAALVLLRERQAKVRYNLRLEERTRIAREMHDTVVQGCIGVSTLIEAAVGCARTDPHQMLECLDNARIHLRLTLDECRQAITDLRHDSFEGGLPGAFSELVQTASVERETPPIRLEISGPSVELPEASSRTLLLVAREAIRNAVVHASPTAIIVRLVFAPAQLRLEIEDDGCGFEPAPRLAASGHFGILGMRERMEQIKGSLDVVSARRKGTLITAQLPLH